MPNFTLGRSNLSTWYVAVLISYLILQPLRPVLIFIVNFVIEVLNNILTIKIVSNDQVWIVLFLVCFIVTWSVQHFFVNELDIKINKDGGKGLELFLLAFSIIGLYLYVLNQTFADQPMPSFFPVWAVHLFGGAKNTFLNAAALNQSTVYTWQVMHGLLWHLGPVAIFWIGSKIDKS